jgi:hypothetical protein
MERMKDVFYWLRSGFAGNSNRRRKSMWWSAVDCLEPRLVLSGNVTATIDRNGDISLVGDNLNNDLRIERISDSVARLSGSSTKINNAYRHFDFNPNHNISISLGGGPDTLTVQGTSVAAPLRFTSAVVDGGDGADRLTVNNVYTTGTMSFNMGGGVAGADEEFARISGSNLGSLSFRTDRTAPARFGPAGRDNLYLTSCTIRGNVALFGGNSLNEFYLNSTLVQGSVQASMGNETDQTSFMTDYFASSNSIIVGSLNVNTGEGWGRVNLIKTKADRINVSMGTSGRDELWLYNTTAREIAVDGGAGGADVIMGVGNRFTFIPQIRGFEKNSLQWIIV